MNPEWKKEKIKTITLLLKDGTHGTHENVKEGVMLLSAKDLVNQMVVPQGNIRTISIEDYHKIHRSYQIQDGDILVSLVGTIGNVAKVIDYKEDYTFQRSVGIIRGDESIVKNNFLFYFFLSNYGYSQLKKYENKGAQGGVYLGNLGSLYVPIPSLQEQEGIITIIEKWDKYIELLDKKIEIKKNTKKYLQQVLLTGKVRLKGYEGEWEEVLLEDICKILKGRELSKEKLVEDGKQECILYGELYTKYQEVIDTVVSRTDSTEGVKSKFGDILIPASTTTNALDVATASCLKKSDVLLGGDINIFRPNESVYSEYLAYLLSHSKKIDMAKLAQGITIIHLYGKDVKEIKISLPPLPEQKAISSILTKSDEEIKTLEKQKSIIEQQRKYLINNLVTGKIRINGN